jgi:hypothetical protein
MSTVGPDVGGVSTEENVGLGQRLGRLIVREWTQTLMEPEDAWERPLARYVFGPEFVCSAARYTAMLSVREVAQTAAMVACGLVEQRERCRPRPLLGDDGEQVVRSDGARAWRCKVREDEHSGGCIEYWLLAGEPIEFGAVAEHEMEEL